MGALQQVVAELHEWRKGLPVARIRAAWGGGWRWHDTGVLRPVRSYRAQPVFFTARMENTRTQYEQVPSGSVVLQGPLHLLFLRPDLLVSPERYDIRTERQFNRVLDEARAAGKPAWRDVDGRPRLIESRDE